MKGKKGISGIPAGIGIGVAVASLITALGAVSTAMLIAGEQLGEQQAVYGAAASLLIGSFTGALLASNMAGEKRMITSVGFGAAFFAILLCVTALFFEGMYENIWLTALLVIGCSAAAGLVGLRKKSTSFRGRRYRVKIP